MGVYIVLLFFVAFIAKGKAEGESKDLCPEGWIQLTDTCGLDGDDVCVKVGQPLKFVSWLHLQFMCDAAGGYLPELTAANKGELDLILSSYDQLYGATLLYLGATDITHTDDWKWLNSRKPLENENWGKDLSSKSNKDCLAQSSETKLWENIDCEDQNIQTQVAFVCMRKKSNGNVAGPTCVNGWSVFGDSCYKYNRELKSWEDARSACRADSVGGADLVSLQSEDENKFVSGLPDNIFELGSTTYGYWTGGIWKDDKGSWSDGSVFKFTNWKKGEPNNKKPAAISFVKGRADWNDENFDAKFPFICEYKLSSGEDRAAGNRTLQNNTNMAGYAPAEEEKNMAKE